ncbi:glutathione ABC transporter substrate-binding protein [Pullulanibacillus sp. KACC 23026]|uniref:glutathione ABC transporter substrate-binding protein n=1 Tax=Pullulanibacillus sp. KACC 23026 TaxID=3028315 RepID=UPI0023B06763|nr:glutathione ABC transporter substrate-binding protein [Pullulanibacillus sp. KACC 23026]WEG13125.1 glutathione ABC transporter substrate-binding protein [Pullulanibacillus sp. KACC 23026]
MKKASIIKLLAVVFVLGLILSGCSSSTSTSSNASGSNSASKNAPQEITYGQTSKVVGLSPIMTNDSVSQNVINQIYETLFRRDSKTNKIEPLLATGYDNPDKLTWVIHLRKGVKFQDGTPFNAEAVKYDFDKFRDPKTGAPRGSLLAAITSVTVKDDYTVVLKTAKPYGPMLADLSHGNAAIVSPTADKKQDLMKNPVGTGPFMLKEWVPGDHVTLVKNPNYWGKAPKLDKVTFKVVPDENTAISMLQTGQIDFLDSIPAEQWDHVKSLNNVTTVKKAGTPISYLAFNTQRAPMNDLAFRQAVSYAIDRDAYVKQLNGLGTKSNSIIGPMVSGYDPSVEKEGYNYDPAKAKKLIDQNGWKGKTINMLVANTPSYMQMAQIVQADLKKVGLNVKMTTMEWGTFLDVSRKGNFDITFLGWTNSTADGSELLYPNLATDNIGTSNIPRYSNKQFDDLVNQSRYSVDQDVRNKALNEANEIAIKDAPWVVMDDSDVSLAYNKNIQGLEVSPEGNWYLNNVYRK